MSQEPRPAVLTLHNHSAQVLTRIEDQVAYAIRWFFVNPGSISSVNEDEMASFRKLNATFGNSPDILAQNVSAKLSAIVSKYLPHASVEVTVERRDGFDRDGVHQGNFGLVIKAIDGSGQPLLPSGRVRVGGEDGTIDCVFDVQ